MYARLSLEELERREVPSGNTLIWTDTNGAGTWSDPKAWKNAVSGEYATPTNGDVLQFDGTVQTNSTDDMSGLNYVAALIVNANFTKTIYLDYSLTVGTADGTNPSGVASGIGGGTIDIFLSNSVPATSNS